MAMREVSVGGLCLARPVQFSVSVWILRRELDGRPHWWTPNPGPDDLFSEWTADRRRATAIPSRHYATTLAEFYEAEVVQAQEVTV